MARQRLAADLSAILVLVEPKGIAATWPRIEGWITKAADRSGGRYTADLIKGYAQRGQWQIWIAIDDAGEVCAVAGTRLLAYDTGLKTIFIQFGTGHRRRIWQHFMADILQWGKEQGCTKAEGCFRQGWLRVLTGWLKTHVFVERDL